MRRMSGLRSMASAGVLGLVGALTLVQPARAQFFWSDQPRFSADDVARAVMRRGFRPISRPTLNDQVYVAEVLDRRGRRERLIVTADSGEIVQRFVIGDERFRREADLSIPRGPVPPGRIPEPQPQRSLFSRLFGDDRDGAVATPDDGDDRLVPTPLQPRPRTRHLPRTVERTPDYVRPRAPIESAPLVPTRAPSPPVFRSPAASTMSSPPATAPAASDRPARSIAHDPLAIPGSREDDGKAAAAAASKSASVPPIKKDVPVAPLE